ncbi:hypothetical protein [Candidatus Similichlamydia epinepheli]|uniref:hypothetical protein n=1 Tax=Candidatus Similichlamydia epinepheli TaxID=1903953 RepID=UPI000D3CE6D7|nr:hypothetical protein [Candidatus Similichlamydia epinepheli]
MKSIIGPSLVRFERNSLAAFRLFLSCHAQEKSAKRLEANLSQIRDLVQSMKVFEKSLSRSRSFLFISFSSFKHVFSSFTAFGVCWKKKIASEGITFIIDKNKNKRIDLVSFLREYLKLLQKTHSHISEWESKSYLALFFFCLSALIFCFSLFCLASPFSILFVGISFLFGTYLFFSGCWDFLDCLHLLNKHLKSGTKELWQDYHSE